MDTDLVSVLDMATGPELSELYTVVHGMMMIFGNGDDDLIRRG